MPKAAKTPLKSFTVIDKNGPEKFLAVRFDIIDGCLVLYNGNSAMDEITVSFAKGAWKSCRPTANV